MNSKKRTKTLVTQITMSCEKPTAEGITHIMCFDVEANAQSPESGCMEELAVCVWKIGEHSMEDELYFLFDSTNGGYCPVTMEEFWDNPAKGKDGKTPAQLRDARTVAEKTEYIDLVDAAEKLTCWAREWYKSTEGKIIVLTDTSGFDYQFISHMLACLGVMPESLKGTGSLPLSLNYLFGKYQPVRDINSWYMGMGGSLQKYGARDLMMERLRIKFPDWVKEYEHDHDPRNDCRSIAAMASFILSGNYELCNKRKNENAAAEGGEPNKKHKNEKDK